LSDTELRTLLREIKQKSEYDYRICKLQYATGSRIGAMANLKLNHFLDEKTVLLPDLKTGHYTVQIDPKIIAKFKNWCQNRNLLSTDYVFRAARNPDPKTRSRTLASRINKILRSSAFLSTKPDHFRKSTHLFRKTQSTLKWLKLRSEAITQLRSGLGHAQNSEAYKYYAPIGHDPINDANLLWRDLI